jgi:NAD+--asparagine ADP-ribosyltransferase
MPEQDYGRGRRDYGMSDYRGGYGRRDYGDYGYDDYGDYGETLSEKELEHWNKKLMEQLDEREKQMFHKDAIMQKAKQMGKPMEGFGEKELYTATLMVYTDYKQSIGQNPDLAVKLAYDWLSDKDVAVKGAEKLAVYYDCIVEGE